MVVWVSGGVEVGLWVMIYEIDQWLCLGFKGYVFSGIAGYSFHLPREDGFQLM